MNATVTFSLVIHNKNRKSGLILIYYKTLKGRAWMHLVSKCIKDEGLHPCPLHTITPYFLY